MDLFISGRTQLTAGSRAFVAHHTGPQGVEGLSLTVRTDRHDGQWTTQVAIARTPDQAWVRANVEHSPPSPDSHLFLPQVVRELMRVLGAIDGHTPLPLSPVHHHDQEQLHALAEALHDPLRRLPLVLASRQANAAWWKLPDGLVQSLTGMAAVHVLEPSAREEIQSLLPVGVRLRPDHLLVLPPRAQAREFDAQSTSQVVDAVLRHNAEVQPPVLVAEVFTRLAEHTASMNSVEGQVYTTASRTGADGNELTTAQTALETERERSQMLTQLERLRGEVTRLSQQVTESNKRAEEAEQELMTATRQRDHHSQRADRAESEVTWLRQQVAAHGLHRLATAAAPAPTTKQGPPASVEELLERITNDEEDLPHLVFTLEEAPLQALALDRTKEALWVGRAWEAFEALEDWCRYRLDHPDRSCGFHQFLTRAPAGYRVIPTHRVSLGESDGVRSSERLLEQRRFPVPPEIDPSMRAIMLAHIKLDMNYGICPRLYFLPDPAEPRVVIGYLGKHLQAMGTN